MPQDPTLTLTAAQVAVIRLALPRLRQQLAEATMRVGLAQPTPEMLAAAALMGDCTTALARMDRYAETLARRARIAGIDRLRKELAAAEQEQAEDLGG